MLTAKFTIIPNPDPNGESIIKVGKTRRVKRADYPSNEILFGKFEKFLKNSSNPNINFLRKKFRPK